MTFVAGGGWYWCELVVLCYRDSCWVVLYYCDCSCRRRVVLLGVVVLCYNECLCRERVFLRVWGGVVL